MDYKAETSKRMRWALKQSNMSLAELARRVDEDYNRMVPYYYGRSQMPPDIADRCAEALNVRAAWLLALIDEPPEAISLNEREKKLVEKYRATDDRGRRQIENTSDAQPGITSPENTPAQSA